MKLSCFRRVSRQMRRWVLAPLLLLAVPVGAQPIPLAVSGYGDASVVVPAGSERRPVVIALHGNFDRPEWMCAAWSTFVGDRAFVLCPRGIQRSDAPDRYELPIAARLVREITAAREALVARYPGRVDEGPDVYVGFSQGAHRIARMAEGDPERYPMIQLVEGGAMLWRESTRYARSSGRAALVCAVRWCERRATALAERLERGHASARHERIPAAHHELDVMAPAIQRTFDWLVSDDPRFR